MILLFPVIRMNGTHAETKPQNKQKETSKVVDFDITVHLQDTLNSERARLFLAGNDEKTFRGARTEVTAPGFKAGIEETHPKPSPEDWYHRFCASSA